jgi:hypothetical protein
MNAPTPPRSNAAYQCGYNPEGRPLAETVAHWATCTFKQCQQSHRNYQETKEEWLRRFGRGVESLDDYPDVQKTRGATA